MPKDEARPSLCFDCKGLVADKKPAPHWRKCGCGAWVPKVYSDQDEAEFQRLTALRRTNELRRRKA